MWVSSLFGGCFIPNACCDVASGLSGGTPAAPLVDGDGTDKARFGLKVSAIRYLFCLVPVFGKFRRLDTCVVLNQCSEGYATCCCKVSFQLPRRGNSFGAELLAVQTLSLSGVECHETGSKCCEEIVMELRSLKI